MIARMHACTRRSTYFRTGRGLQDKELDTVVSLCQQIHKHVQAASEDFHRELGRNIYVSPTSYLELLSIFKTLLSSKRSENRQLTSRYTVGLKKLQSSVEQVAVMQTELTALKPQLVQTVAQVEALMSLIAQEKCDVVQPKAEARCSSPAFLCCLSRCRLAYT